LRHGLEQTHGDLIVICDAEARPCSGLLEETLGYFRDSDVAWVQTPQPALEPLEFDDVVHHRSSWCNGSFCCAAGSVHRREALQEAARQDVSAHGVAGRAEPRRNWKSVCHPRAVTEHLASGIVAKI
jgi:cellulose synthase (UDP-forming)